MTIIDLHKAYYGQVNTRWIPTITPLSSIMQQSGYNEHHNMIDNYFTRQYANLIVNEDMFDFASDNIREQISNHFSSVLYSNLENIKRQFEIVQAEYNPIENYDRYEELDKTTNTITNAPRTTTDKLDKVTNNSVSKTTGFNETNLVTDSGIETTSSGTASGGKIENVRTEAQAIDTEVHSGTGTDGKINNHLHGNIGVTQSTEMLSNHYSFWVWFNFYEYIFNLCFEFISIGLYDTYDVEVTSGGSTPTPTPTPTPTGEVDWSDIKNKPTLLTPTDIVDNLTSTATNKPLSANQGHRLFTMYEDTSELVNQVEATLESTQEVVEDNTQNITSLDTRVTALEQGGGGGTSEEIVIGMIGNDKLYQKTILLDVNLPLASTLTRNSFDILIPNINIVYDTSVTISKIASTGAISIYPLPYINRSGGIETTLEYISNTSKKITILNIHDWSDCTLIVTLKYTKNEVV